MRGSWRIRQELKPRIISAGSQQTGRAFSRDGVLDLLERCRDGTTELIVHPGYVDDDLVASPRGCRLAGDGAGDSYGHGGAKICRVAWYTPE